MVGTTVSERVVQTVAEQSDTDALDLPPLFDILDPDLLDGFIQELTEGEASFDYAGYHITVDTHGVIEVEEHPLAGDIAKEAAGED